MAKKIEKADSTAAKGPKAAEAKKIDAKIGSMVEVRVVKHPSSERATKTLKRILGKDRGNHKRKETLQKHNIRSMRSKIRGGVWYETNVSKRTLVYGKVGDTGVVKATADVIADLNSVARFVDVKAAK